MAVKMTDILLAENFSTMHLPNDLHVGFMEREAGRFETLNQERTGDNALPAALVAQIGVFRQAFAQEKQVYLVVNSSAYSQQIADLDTQRDQDYMALVSFLESYERFMGNPQLQQKATTVLTIIRRYKIDVKANYEREGVRLNEMIDELQNNLQVEQALEALNATFMLTELKRVNDECRRLVNLRQEERAQLEKGQMLAARKVVDDEYRVLVLALNGAALLDETGQQYQDFIRLLNEDVNYYRSVVLQKRTTDDDPQPDDTTPADGGVTPAQPE